MPSSDDDHLIAELRRLIANVDPLPAPLQAEACAAFGAPARGLGGSSDPWSRAPGSGSLEPLS